MPGVESFVLCLCYQYLEKEAKELSEKATSGMFLDPDNNPMQILRKMKVVRERKRPTSFKNSDRRQL